MVVETLGPGSAVGQARELAERGCSIVAAFGGDGTVSQVMNGLLGSDSALAVIPGGTGNDFARTLGLGTDLHLALDALARGFRRRVDVGSWRRGDQSGAFLNVSGLGFDAEVADRINRGYRHVRGSLAYFMAILATLRSFRPRLLQGIVDGEPFETHAMLCALANAQSYGGGLRIAPQASLDDGLLDLVIVGEFGTLELLRNYRGLRRGTHVGHPNVTCRRFRSLVIESEPASPLLVDGELLPPGRAEIEVLPKAIEVASPHPDPANC